MEQLLLKPAQVADSLGLSRSTVYALISARILPSIRVGGRTLVSAEALRRWVEARNRTSVARPRGAGG
jgi:excisionase family DNA binding protein